MNTQHEKFLLEKNAELEKELAEKNRELEIETALEKVRVRAMAMHKSDELREVVAVVFEKLQVLNFSIDGAAFIITFIEGSKDSNVWIGDDKGQSHPTSFRLPFNEAPPVKDFWLAKESGVDFFSRTYSFEEKNDWFNYPFEHTDIKMLSDQLKKWIVEQPCLTQSCAFGKNSMIGIYFHHQKTLSETEADILKRVSKVFDQAYTRFLDLQKAEAQAREAQIEAALERVRSRTMGMQKSEELKEVIQVVFEQFVHLNINVEHTGFVIDYKARDDYDIWIADPLGVPSQVIVPYFDSVYYNRFNEAKEKGEDFFATNLSFEEKNRFYQKLFEYVPGLPEEAKEFYFSCPGLAASTVLLENVCLYIENFSGTPYTDEENDTLRRFGKVFQQTYTRFLDLKKAEAQAREAQIELGLERVRAKAMATQNSDELNEIVAILFEELTKLDLVLTRCIIWIFDADTLASRLWMANSEDRRPAESFYIKPLDHPYYKAILDGWKQREIKWFYELKGHEKKSIDLLLLNETELSHLSPAVKAGILNAEHASISGSFGNFGMIEASGPIALSTEQAEILARFTKEFERAYTRFLDLQKAEAQAREAQIEAALERVRSRSMGMQKSEELREIIQVIYEQFIQLGIKIDSAGFAMDYMESDDFNFWFADSYSTFPNKVHVPYFDHPQFNRFKEAKEKGLDFYTSNLTFEEKNKFFDHVLKDAPPIPQELREVFYSAPGYISSHVVLKNIVLYILNYTDIPFSDAENAILMRFGKVFEQTYIRFNDLKQAEAQAREVVKRASVDRVRAEIASMRTTTDLERIQPLIWNELTTLGVPFIRCGVFIMDEEQQLVHTFLSTPEGKAIATLHVPFEFNLSIITNGVGHWRKKEIYKEHWNAATFTKSWIALSSLMETSDGSHQHEQPPKNLYLHMLPFLQGMLYAGNTAPLSDDELQLVQNLAGAFSTAYARYEDFNKLESANIKIERTLVDLKQAQAQLVQSEKMASLGQLTAGIAHEIQNPLNFVNNFSEINTELIEEMKTELRSGNNEAAISIANDIAENEQKINHHGKRADAIVKGMLQHSRTSSGQKEPTDINALADEYLRLAYHGLRAKDKSFNATLKTDFDETTGNINVIPQDIGRVLLNLINNAFYAVNEKKKQQPDGYEPAVSIITKKIADKVEIAVSDNGNGIPKKVVDKIFQPFFTTKPTGQGTGLGLSLAYDIIKANGGELKLETEEGEGSEFIIQLPIS